VSGVGDARALQAQQAADKKQQAAADAQWKKALAANAGGGNEGFSSNFEAAGGLDGLRAMIESADPGALMTVAGHWTGVGEDLTSISSGLSTHVNNLLEHWTGASADAFRASASTLNESLTNGAGYAHSTSGALTTASSALSEAQANMPHAPSEWAKASRSVTSESNDWQFKQDAAKVNLQYAITKDGGQLSADEEAHQKAVLVMEGLGKAYNNSSAQLKVQPPRSTGDGVWPPPVPTPGGPPVTQPVGTVPDSPGSAGFVPLTNSATGPESSIPGVNVPSQPTPGGPVQPNPGGGIFGGKPGQPVTPPGTTIDGTPGGPVTGVGSGYGGGSNGGGIGGVGGYGSVGNVGSGGNGAGFGFGGVGGVGSGAFGAGDGDGADGYGGDSGLMSGSADGADSAAAGSAAEEAELGSGDGVNGAGASGEGEGAMGEMGGMGGGLGSAAKKKKRKARASYLVADEDAWGTAVAVNPAVIS